MYSGLGLPVDPRWELQVPRPLSKLQSKVVAVRTAIWYISEKMAFDVFSELLKREKFSEELNSAIQSNLRVLTGCEKSRLVSD